MTLTKGICIPICADINCNICSFSLSVSPAIYCQQCLSGYELDSTNLCVLCASNTYYDTATFTCVLCSSVIAYCLTCSDSLTCNSCDYSLTPSGSTCLPTCSDVNCLSCSFSVPLTICSQCSSGFIVDPNNQQVCISCASGTYYNSSTIACTACSSVITYCLTCSSSTSCTSCDYSLAPSGSTCLPTCSDVNCLSCSFSVPTGIICNFCASGYIINSSNQSQYVVCSTGTYYNSSTLTCTKCNSVLQYCTDCTSITLCNSCDYSLIIVSGSCAPNCIFSNCQSCSFSVVTGTVCSNCASAYKISPSDPTLCIPLCGDGIMIGSETCDDANL